MDASRRGSAGDPGADRPLLLAVPDHDHPHHPVVLVGMRHGWALDEEPVALEPDEAGLLAPDPAFVPGGIDLGDHLAVLNPVTAGIGDHGAQRLCAVFIGLRNDPALGGDEREPDPVSGRDLAAPGMLAVDGRSPLALLVLVDDRNKLPVADDLLLE